MPGQFTSDEVNPSHQTGVSDGTPTFEDGFAAVARVENTMFRHLPPFIASDFYQSRGGRLPNFFTGCFCAIEGKLCRCYSRPSNPQALGRRGDPTIALPQLRPISELLEEASELSHLDVASPAPVLPLSQLPLAQLPLAQLPAADDGNKAHKGKEKENSVANAEERRVATQSHVRNLELGELPIQWDPEEPEVRPRSGADEEEVNATDAADTSEDEHDGISVQSADDDSDEGSTYTDDNSEDYKQKNDADFEEEQPQLSNQHSAANNNMSEEKDYGLPEVASSCHHCDEDDNWDGMIQCDGKHDEERWFHWKCARLSPNILPADDAKWYCDECRGRENSAGDEDEFEYEEERKKYDTPPPCRPISFEWATTATDLDEYVLPRGWSARAPTGPTSFIIRTPTPPAKRAQPSHKNDDETSNDDASEPGPRHKRKRKHATKHSSNKSATATDKTAQRDVPKFMKRLSGIDTGFPNESPYEEDDHETSDGDDSLYSDDGPSSKRKRVQETKRKRRAAVMKKQAPTVGKIIPGGVSMLSQRPTGVNVGPEPGPSHKRKREHAAKRNSKSGIDTGSPKKSPYQENDHKTSDGDDSVYSDDGPSSKRKRVQEPKRKRRAAVMKQRAPTGGKIIPGGVSMLLQRPSGAKVGPGGFVLLGTATPALPRKQNQPPHQKGRASNSTGNKGGIKRKQEPETADDDEIGPSYPSRHKRQREQEPKGNGRTSASKTPARTGAAFTLRALITPPTSSLPTSPTSTRRGPLGLAAGVNFTTPPQTSLHASPGPLTPASTPRAAHTQGGESDRWPRDLCDKIATLVQERVDANHFKEDKWSLIEAQLQARFNIARSASGIKNYWGRKGRAFYGLDERRVPKPDKMVTGVEDPEVRRRKRQVAKGDKKNRGRTRGIKMEEEEDSRDEEEE